MSKEAPSSSGGGRFEMAEAKFTELTKSKPSEVHKLDLKDALPDLFVGTDRVPRLVQRVWRRACDEVMAENRGNYAYTGGTVIKIFFHELTAGIAKAKVDTIKRKIQQILKAVQSGDESALEAPLPGADKTAFQTAPPEHSSLATLVKGGLPANPELEMVQVWAGRVLQNMMASTQKIPMTREMIDVASKADVSYCPLWNAAGEVIVGSVGDVKSAWGPAQQNPGEPYRMDLAMLFSACFQLYSLQSKGANSLAVIPVRTLTLLNNEIGELYIGLLRRNSPEIQKSVIIEITGLPKGTISPRLATALDKIQRCTRAVVFQTGLLAYNDYARLQNKPHACGFDSDDTHIGEHEQARLMKKYVDHYQVQGIKSMVKHVHSPFVFDAAIKNNFTYISGPFIRTAQKSGFTMQKMSAADIKAKGGAGQ